MRRNPAASALAILLGGFLAVSVACATVDTAEQAMAIASQFASTVTWQYGDPSSATLATDDLRGPLWTVEFSGAANVAIEQGSGQVVAAVDESQGALLDGTSPVPQNVTQQEARDAADQLLAAIGQPSDCQFGSIGQNGDGEWVIAWVRVLDGIPYHDDGVTLEVSPISGKMVLYTRALISNPPASGTVTVTQEEAIAAANGFALAAGVPDDWLTSASAALSVVQANDYWTTPPIAQGWRLGAPSRVAWEVTYGPTGEPKKYFWVDAQDASLLGGTQQLGPGYTTKRITREHAGFPLLRQLIAATVAIAALAVCALSWRRRSRSRVGS